MATVFEHFVPLGKVSVLVQMSWNLMSTQKVVEVNCDPDVNDLRGSNGPRVLVQVVGRPKPVAPAFAGCCYQQTVFRSQSLRTVDGDIAMAEVLHRVPATHHS